MKPSLLLILFFVATAHTAQAQDLYKTTAGEISFQSTAEQEDIKASTREAKGIIDLASKKVAFTIEMKSFDGFNSPLQREHFNENYLESKRFPHSTFTGKLIDDFDKSNTGTQQIRVKGIFDIHGIKAEKIVKGSVTNKNGTLYLDCKFTVTLADFDIPIPKIVSRKISPEIDVRIKATLKPAS